MRGVLSGVTWFRECSSPVETDRWIQNEGGVREGSGGEGRGGEGDGDVTSRHAQAGEGRTQPPEPGLGRWGPGETRVVLVARCPVLSTVF